MCRYLVSSRNHRLGIDSRAIHQFDVGHRRIVANAETHLQDAQVAAVTGGVARAEFVEELADDLAVAQAIEGQTAIGQAGDSCRG